MRSRILSGVAEIVEVGGRTTSNEQEHNRENSGDNTNHAPSLITSENGVKKNDAVSEVATSAVATGSRKSLGYYIL